jgi:hypothetical protein
MKDGEAESLIRWAKHDLDTKYCEVDWTSLTVERKCEQNFIFTMYIRSVE